jgi:hypothetical protein
MAIGNTATLRRHVRRVKQDNGNLAKTTLDECVPFAVPGRRLAIMAISSKMIPD